MKNEYILLGIIIGVLIFKFLFPILEGILDVICLKIEEWKNDIAYRINEKNNIENCSNKIGFDTGGDRDE